VFEKIGVLEEWRTSVSDDYSLTRALEQTNHSILFVPECLTLSFVETDIAGLLEFTNRQVLITRVYAEKMWAYAVATHAFYCVTVVLGLALGLGEVVAQRTALPIFAVTFLIFLLSAIRSALRVVGVTEIFPASRALIMNQSWIYIALTAAIPFLYMINFVNSVVTRKIRWRGVGYELMSPNETRIIAP
jgi:hypothetical protein